MYKAFHTEVITEAHTEAHTEFHLLNGLFILAKQKPYSIYRNKAFNISTLIHNYYRRTPIWKESRNSNSSA